MPRRQAPILTITLGLMICVAPDSPADPDPPDRLRRTAEVEAEPALRIPPGAMAPDLRMHPIAGEPFTLSGRGVRRDGPLVIAFTSTGCPLSARYAPRLASIEDEFRRRGVGFVYVNSVEAETLRDMKEQIREHGFDGPYVADHDRTIAEALGARTTTETFVLDKAGMLIYRGAVDDQYGVGTALARPRNNYLRDAIESALLGERPPIASVWPPGCLLNLAKEPVAAPASVTYNGRIAGILAERCVRCHQSSRSGAAAPFGLDSFEVVSGRSSMIEAVVRDGLMPPWPLGPSEDPERSPWRHDRSLTESERHDLLAWLRSDRPIGDQHLAPAPRPPSQESWSIGAPDRIYLPSLSLTSPGGEGPLQHLRVVIPTHLEADQRVEALEFRPVKRDSIHHAIVWLLEPGMRLPATDEAPQGLSLLAVFSPGVEPIVYDRGVKPRIPAGSVLIVDLYARPMGRDMKSTLRLAMRFSKSPAERSTDRVMRSFVMSADRLSIPAGSQRAETEFETLLEQGARIRALTPITGARGREVSVTAVLPGGERLILLDAPSFDFRWLMRFELNEPVTLPPGTRLIVRGVFDNSSGNANVDDPALEPRMGPGADSEQLTVGIEAEGPLGDEE